MGVNFRNTFVLRQVGLLLWMATGSVADEARLTEEINSSFFHVKTEGTPRVGSGRPNTSYGKAFAVGSELLVTSQHVIGRHSDWVLKDDATVSERVVRVIPKFIDREVTIAKSDASQLFPHFEMPSRGPSSDVTYIAAPDAKFEHPFELSICQIESGGSYRALLVAGNPEHETSTRNTKFVELTASGFHSEKYGPLYAFEIENANGVKLAADGHDGSPIVDSQGLVVGLVSAILRESGNFRILATLMRPLLDAGIGTLSVKSKISRSEGARRTCSLAEQVENIQRYISRHADWHLIPGRDRDGRLNGELKLRYDSLSAEPNIGSINVEYGFHGKKKDSRPRIDRVGDALVIAPTVDGEWEFDLNQIIKEGRALEESLNDENEGGYILFVRLYIEPTKLYPDGRLIEKAPVTVRELQWR